MGLSTRKLLPGRIFIDIAEFHYAPTAPTIVVNGGEAGTVAIGIDSDANGAALSKTTATQRTGITGVQVPNLMSTTDSQVILQEAGGSLRILGALINNPGDSVTKTFGFGGLWGDRDPFRLRVFWTTSSTTPSQSLLLDLYFANALNDGQELLVTGGEGMQVTDAPGSVANRWLVTPWSAQFQPLRDLKSMNDDSVVPFQIFRNASSDVTGDTYLLGLEVEVGRSRA